MIKAMFVNGVDVECDNRAHAVQELTEALIVKGNMTRDEANAEVYHLENELTDCDFYIYSETLDVSFFWDERYPDF